MNPDIIGVTEAAKIIGITTSVVYYHVTNGNLKPVGRFGKSLILDRAAVEAFKAKREGSKWISEHYSRAILETRTSGR